MKRMFTKFILKTAEDITNYVEKEGVISDEDLKTMHAEGLKEKTRPKIANWPVLKKEPEETNPPVLETTSAELFKDDIVKLLGKPGEEVVGELRDYNQILESMIFNVIDLLEV